MARLHSLQLQDAGTIRNGWGHEYGQTSRASVGSSSGKEWLVRLFDVGRFRPEDTIHLCFAFLQPMHVTTAVDLAVGAFFRGAEHRGNGLEWIRVLGSSAKKVTLLLHDLKKTAQGRHLIGKGAINQALCLLLLGAVLCFEHFGEVFKLLMLAVCYQ